MRTIKEKTAKLIERELSARMSDLKPAASRSPRAADKIRLIRLALKELRLGKRRNKTVQEPCKRRAAGPCIENKIKHRDNNGEEI